MKIKDWIAFIVLGTLWGSSFLWIKIAVQEISPIMLVACRLFFAILPLSAALMVLKPQLPKNRRIWAYLIILGFTNSAIPYLLISWGVQHIDSAVAAVLNSTTPLFAMILAHFSLLDDRITWQRFIGLGLGFAGVVILLSRDVWMNQNEIASLELIPTQNETSSMLFVLLGQLAILLASFFYAVSSVFARRTLHQQPRIIQGLFPLIGADAVLWFMVINSKNSFSVPHLPITWISILWLGIIGTGFALLLYFYLIHSVGPTRTTIVTYIFPLVGVFLGVVFLNELLDWHLLFGGILIIGSIVFVNQLP